MKTKKFKNVFIMGMSLTALNVWAAPSAFEAKKCGKLEIQNKTSSTVVRDHEDCTKVWVLPPDMGIATTKHFRRSGNLGFCMEMKDLQKSSHKISKRIAKLSENIDRYTPEILKAQKKLQAAKGTLAFYKNAEEVLTFRKLQNKVEDIELRLSEIEDKLDQCKQSCEELSANYKDLRQEKYRLNKELRNLRQTNRVAVRNFERAKVKVESAEENLEYHEDFVLKLVKKQKELHTLVNDLYKNYASIEGGSVTVDYDLNWTQNLIQLETEYPQYNFSKVPTKEARLSAHFVGASSEENYLKTLPVLLDYSIAGFKYLPYGEQSTNDLVSIPNKLQGDLRLSLIGGCPYYYKNFLDSNTTSNDLEADQNLNQKEFGYGMSMTYLYPAVFRFELEAKYNLYKFYKKVVRSGSSGGLFSSRSWKKVNETKIDKDTFEINWLDEGGRYSQEEKNAIRNTIKTELTARALQNMGHRAGSKTGPLVAMHTYTPQPGALVLAQGLNETCGWNIYCKAGSWILKGLSSVFGGSRAEASFQSTHDSTVVEKWNEEEVKFRAGASGFSETK